MLHEFAGDFGSGAGGQGAQFVERFFGAEVGGIGAPAGRDAGGVIASRLGAGSDRGTNGFTGPAPRAELHAHEKRPLPAFRWVQHCLGLVSRTAPVSQSQVVLRNQTSQSNTAITRGNQALCKPTHFILGCRSSGPLSALPWLRPLPVFPPHERGRRGR